MALALDQKNFLVLLPLSPKEEKFLLKIIKKYNRLVEKRKFEKARKFILKHIKDLNKIFTKLCKVDPSLIAILKILSLLERSHNSKLEHVYSFITLKYFEDLAEKFENIEKRLYFIEKK